MERLLFAGRKDGMWCADWTPPGGKVDLFTHLKNKLKGMRSMEAMESRYQKSIAERRSQSRDDTN